ncbi:MAG: quinolinate synthase NadA [Proteobacteria bacterium]|nr:quinolinate synthase NadA [Pseudomonadota bacterium]
METQIEKLKRELNAVVLAHYYQKAEVQDCADFVGDSLALAQQAAQTTADVIVFCGVHFMAETAKILNPGKLVLLPDTNAGCSLSDSCPPEAFAAFKAQQGDCFVVSYVNSSAAIKAQSDVICTSSNAVKIVSRIPAGRRILFAPDKHLGRYAAKQTGREMVLWPGSCTVHEMFSEKNLLQLKYENPQALVVAHPECTEAVLAHADFIGSTAQLLERVTRGSESQFIVVTEPGILHQMRKASPQKYFLSPPSSDGCPCNVCPHMKLNTLEKLHACMKNRSPQVELPEKLRQQALAPLKRMLEWS